MPPSKSATLADKHLTEGQNWTTDAPLPTANSAVGYVGQVPCSTAAPAELENTLLGAWFGILGECRDLGKQLALKLPLIFFHLRIPLKGQSCQ